MQALLQYPVLNRYSTAIQEKKKEGREGGRKAGSIGKKENNKEKKGKRTIKGKEREGKNKEEGKRKKKRKTKYIKVNIKKMKSANPFFLCFLMQQIHVSSHNHTF